MSLFKTKEQIEEMAKEYANSFTSRKFQPYRNTLIDYFNGYTQAQKDLLESASEGFEECFKNGRNGKGETPSQIEEWQACALFHKAKIDTLKQRELEYQSDLRQKDAEIDSLKKKISSFDAYASADEKYQEAVKDIDYFLTRIEDIAEKSEDEDSILMETKFYKTKYRLNKKEKIK